MTANIDQLLGRLRDRGDPVLEGVSPKSTAWPAVLTAMETKGIAAMACRRGWDEMRNTNAFFKACTNALIKQSQPSEVDWRDVVKAQDLFSRFGNEIGSALLLAALPQTYASERGAKVLTATTRLTRDLTRRVRGTAQFLMLIVLATTAEKGLESYTSTNVYTQSDDQICDAVRASWDAGTGVRWRVCATLRVFHEAIRRSQKAATPADDVDEPLNQEDLLGALLTFSITVFEVLDQFGISWTSEDQLAYLRTWNVIGTALGVTGLPSRLPETPFASPLAAGLPSTVDDARRLLTAIRTRNWVPVDHYESLLENLSNTEAGVELVAALLKELTSELAWPLQRLPEVVMRQLAEPVVRDRLGLGGGGLLQAVADYAPAHRPGDRWSMMQLPRRARQIWLRQAANTVSRAATVNFIKTKDGQTEFVIPGLFDWSDGWRARQVPRFATATGKTFDLAAALGQ